MARGLVAVAALAALVAAARLLVAPASAPRPVPALVCLTPVELALPGEPARVACAGDPPLAGCGELLPGDRVERTGTGCTRSPGGMSAPARVALGLRLDVNRAAADDLVLLDGIGPHLAAAIVAEREAHGRYTSLDDLRRVRGVGPRVLERLGPMLEAGPGGPARGGP